MASAEATIHLGEIFLETADGTKISLGQLKAPFNISLDHVFDESVKDTVERLSATEPKPIQIGSRVKISDAPKCWSFGEGLTGWVDPEFAGKTGKVTNGLNEEGNWGVKHDDGTKQWISPEHLTVVD